MQDSPFPAEGAVLAVDLDGTLVCSDLLFESFWASMSKDGPETLRQMLSATGGRAGLKKSLAGQGHVDVTLLPYNAEVVAYVQGWRERGGRTALVTASDQSLADQVAGHLGLFDEVHGSDGVRNLKGPTKAAFLTERYGAGGYVYIGDATADLPVWSDAAQIVTVNAPRGLRARAAALGPETTHLGESARPIGAWLRALRPHQWIKNVLVFLPVLTSHALSFSNVLNSVLAFIAFSLVASSVYLFNDLLDLSADRDHPRKRSRPLAAGAIPIGPASIFAPMLLLAGGVLALFLNWYFVIALGVYFAITAAYSLHLKRRTIVDIWVLAILYSMRIAAGAAATNIVPSVWLMAFSIFFFFSLAAVKRQAELVDIADEDGLNMRRRGYARDDVLLIAMMAIASGYVSILVMALYIRTPFINQLYEYPPVLLGICLVLLYWISRIVMVTHRGLMHDDPLVYALRDRISQICVLLCIGLGVLAYAFPGGT